MKNEDELEHPPKKLVTDNVMKILFTSCVVLIIAYFVELLNIIFFGGTSTWFFSGFYYILKK